MRSLAMSLLAILALSVPARGDVLWFEDDFEGAVLDTSVWVVEPGGGTVYVQDGWLHLEAMGPQVYFPFVHLKENPFPDGDLRCEVRMQYVSVFIFGNGHSCSTLGGLPFWTVWQGLSTSLLVKIFGADVYQDSGVIVEPHDFVFQLVGQECTAFMDGSPLGSLPSAQRPAFLAFGHNPETVPGWEEWWTTFRVDYVRIWSLCDGPSEAEASTWSRLKALYR